MNGKTFQIRPLDGHLSQISVGGWVLPCIWCPSTVKCVHSKDGRLVLMTITWNRAWPPGEPTQRFFPAGTLWGRATAICKRHSRWHQPPSSDTRSGSAEDFVCFLWIYTSSSKETPLAKRCWAGERAQRRMFTMLNTDSGIMQRKIVSADGVGNTFHCLLRDLQHCFKGCITGTYDIEHGYEKRLDSGELLAMIG